MNEQQALEQRVSFLENLVHTLISEYSTRCNVIYQNLGIATPETPDSAFSDSIYKSAEQKTENPRD